MSVKPIVVGMPNGGQLVQDAHGRTQVHSPSDAERIAATFAKAKLAKMDFARVTLRKSVEAYQAKHDLPSYEIALSRAIVHDRDARAAYNAMREAEDERIDAPHVFVAKRHNADVIAPLVEKREALEDEFARTHNLEGSTDLGKMQIRDRLRKVSPGYVKLEAQIANAEQSRDAEMQEVGKRQAERVQAEAVAKREAEVAAQSARELAAKSPAKRALEKRVAEFAAEQSCTVEQAYTRGAAGADLLVRSLAEIVKAEG